MTRRTGGGRRGIGGSRLEILKIRLLVVRDRAAKASAGSWSGGMGRHTDVGFRGDGVLWEILDRIHITARYENGVLTATIPVAEEAKPRKVKSPTPQLLALTATTVPA